MVEKPIWWEYLTFYLEEDEPDYDGVHSGGIKGVRNDAPRDVNKEYEEYMKNCNQWSKSIKIYYKYYKEESLKVCLCFSDAHPRLQAAIRKSFIGSVWQRCKVHFMRNIMASVPKRQKESFGAELKKIWQEERREDAIKRKDAFGETWNPKYPMIRKSWESHWNDLNDFSSPPIRRR